MANVQLHVPNQAHLYDQVFQNAARHLPMATADSRSGTLAICGAGPSLNDHLGEIDAPEIWACNSALPYLLDRGVPVTHGFAIDQGEAMLADWPEAYPVAYFLASSVHPSLLAHLATRPVTLFHSFLGLPAPAHWVEHPTFGGYEDWLYRKLYPASICVGAGLNSVPRAISLAVAMGYTDIRVYGADCACRPQPVPPPCSCPCAAYAAWLATLVLYADGRSPAIYGPAEPMLRWGDWYTRADMLISAEHLVKLDREYPDRITYIGDTMVTALLGQPDAFWTGWARLNNDTSVIDNLHRPDPVGV